MLLSFSVSKQISRNSKPPKQVSYCKHVYKKFKIFRDLKS